MKSSIITGLIMLLFFGVSCNDQPEKSKSVAEVSGNDVEVYYFHLNTRCVTCRTIEAEARKNVEMLYPELFKEGKMSFIALNLEEPSGKSAGDRLGVNGQTLLIVKGDRRINITNEGFLYAVSKPDKFREVIKEKIDSLMD